ncbi:hypothetical protein [Cellulophaga sp. Z1A5H]|uniref:hypothetical protein n=1 Tax=Cellulophaga sp. Z1A5H TaxID=2687291 RepID=UPI0013FDE2C3|nr:hypothetical protein [Cellulophaga sp. Z1A5H]
MKKINILSILLISFVSFISFGQDDTRYVEGNGFNSIFQNLESGNFEGTINGVLIVKDSDNEQSLLDFQGSYAKLEIEKDEYKVYDVSRKKYTGKTTSGKTKIKYETYAYANSFGIELKGEYYNLNLIDGACDYIINGLEYTYQSEKSAEYLIMRFTKEVKLMNDYDSDIRKTIKLLPNSTLVFVISRNKKL